VLVARMLEQVRRQPRYGYRRIWALLRQEGWQMNSKRVYRLWRREGLRVAVKHRKRRLPGSSENGCARRRPEHKDHVWAWDFIHDRTTSGGDLRCSPARDDAARAGLHASASMPVAAGRGSRPDPARADGSRLYGHRPEVTPWSEGRLHRRLDGARYTVPPAARPLGRPAGKHAAAQPANSGAAAGFLGRAPTRRANRPAILGETPANSRSGGVRRVARSDRQPATQSPGGVTPSAWPGHYAWLSGNRQTRPR
jgi:hypothetical protein